MTRLIVDPSDLSNRQTAPVAETDTPSFLQNIWYYAAHSDQLKRGKTLKKTICGEDILLGRDRDGNVFALHNLCPHQGMPFHHGRFDGREVECCFHGWRFQAQGGACTAIPSLVEDQQSAVCKISVKSYPCQEAQGNVWVFIGDQSHPLPPFPLPSGVEEYPYQRYAKNTLNLPSHIDIAIIGLMDPAHVPFVHNSWWFSNARRIHDKRKTFAPDRHGYTMVRHTPSKNATIYKILDKLIGNTRLETEISFQLPGIRIERIMLGGHTLFSGFTALTPVDDTHTEMNHTTYWITPWLTPLAPIISRACQTFLAQDVKFAHWQSEGLRTQPKNLLMTIKDAGTPVRWYYHLKRAWTAAALEGRPFVNPLKSETLRWRS